MGHGLPAYPDGRTAGRRDSTQVVAAGSVKASIAMILSTAKAGPQVLWLLTTDSGHQVAGGLSRDRYAAGLALAKALTRHVVATERLRLRYLRGEL